MRSALFFGGGGMFGQEFSASSHLTSWPFLTLLIRTPHARDALIDEAPWERRAPRTDRPSGFVRQLLVMDKFTLESLHCLQFSHIDWRSGVVDVQGYYR